MEAIFKSAQVAKQQADESELALINRQTLRQLSEDEVFTFRLAACDNQVDRDFERFTDKSLDDLADLFVGKTVLRDHSWSAGSQTARVYAAGVEDDGRRKRLILRCYMPRSGQSTDTIEAIETGMLRECSVGCRMERAVCTVCGADQTKTSCAHIPGREYDGNLCVMELDGAKDAYEVSLVAVPAQPEAGVVKSKRYGGKEPDAPETPKNPPHSKSKEPASVLERLAAMMKGKEVET